MREQWLGRPFVNKYLRRAMEDGQIICAADDRLYIRQHTRHMGHYYIVAKKGDLITYDNGAIGIVV